MQVAEKHHPDRVGPARRWLSALAGPAILFLIVSGFFWKLVLTDQYTWLYSSDIANQVLPWLQFQAREWQAHRLPLWDPYQWFGQPLLGQAQPGGAYPLNWLLFSIPLANGMIQQWALHWYFVIIHVLAAVFAWWLCRDLKCSRMAAVVGGAVFALSGYMGTTEWPQMLNGAVWAPLIFLFLFRVIRGRRAVLSAALAGAALGASWLSGHHQAPIFLSLTSFSLLFWFMLNRGHRGLLNGIKLSIIFVVFLILISGLQVLPALEYGHLASRWVGTSQPIEWNEKVPYLIHSTYSLQPYGLLSVALPGMDKNATPFMGIAAFSLAVAAIWFGRREFATRALALLGIAGLLFALGGVNLFHGILYAIVPLVEKARNPSQAILIFNFAFSVLSAKGIDVLLRRESDSRRFPALVAAAGGFLLLLSVIVTIAGHPVNDDRVITSGFLAILFAAAALFHHRGMLGDRATVAAFLALILIELGNVSAVHLPHRYDHARMAAFTALSRHSDIAAFLEKQQRPFRVEVDDKDIAYNFGDWYGIEDAGGYLASVTSNLMGYDIDGVRLRSMFGVVYSISKEPKRPGWREVFTGGSGLKVFENPNVFPRAWAVHDIVAAKDMAELRRYVGWDGFDLRRRTALLQPFPAVETCPGEDRVQVNRHAASRVEMTADMNCGGLVVLADVFYPGWQATLDGKPARIHAANGMLRGVEVPAGHHTITMVYRPRSVIAGASMTLAGLASLALLALLSLAKPKALD